MADNGGQKKVVDNEGFRLFSVCYAPLATN